MVESKNLIEMNIEDEMKDSYLTYAMSVIIQRALPDVRDGLKPSQRRILVAMNDLGLAPRGRYLKCAKIAGDTSGNYHPHGESVVYPTLVRLAQPWNMRYELIEGQGNFGSPDGDPPAAMRYTEARLRGPAVDLMQDLDKETVDYVANFDGRLQEPTVLPGKFPNILCNGSSGIAVGMATNLPPNNLNEVLDGLIAVVKNPDISIMDILEIIPGPDFPTGGIICGRSNARRAYMTGRGHVTVRSRVSVEEKSRDRYSIIVTEIPYQVNKTKLVESIVDCVNNARVQGISDVRDESDQKGQRLVIELKRNEEPDVVLNQLFKFTPLQTNISIINIALVDGEPKTLNIKEMLALYIQHRFEVIRRRTAYLLAKAEARAHILEGLLRALDMIDEIIAVIRASSTPKEAGINLMREFGFTEPQATHIRQMPLQTLTGLERERLQNEYNDLMVKIAYWRRVMQEDGLVYDIMFEEWAEIRKKFGDPRRSSFGAPVEEIEDEDLIPVEQMVVTITQDGYIKRTPLDQYKSQGRGGVGIRGSGTKEGDVVRNVFITNTHNFILFFTNHGRLHWLKVYRVPEGDRTSKGRAIVNLLNLDKNEETRQELCRKDLTEGFLVFATRNGTVKRTELAAYSRPKRGGIRAIALDEGDELIAVEHAEADQEVMISTRQGWANRFAIDKIRATGRISRGVRGITLRPGDDVVSMAIVREGDTLLTVCSKGYGKRSAVAQFTIHNRGGKGVTDIKTGGRNGYVVAAKPVSDDDEIILITVQGLIIRLAAQDISIIGRGTMGVRVIRLRKGDEVASMGKIPAEVLAEERENAEAEADEAGEAGEAPEENAAPDPVKDDADGGTPADESGDDAGETSGQAPDDDQAPTE